ncbi:hypothetical protein AXF15_05535 [Desulfomicrobium orale DSM 12838]|uniref:Uncharacterized protein n=1 Tax=Desulfomicrobium orale DSM 12838 TaxID=888061 RepID=A0A109W5T0_9BACT|nr:hypothetical protein AXF15_05535 [Desulfomicrobium orale DSM 12838]
MNILVEDLTGEIRILYMKKEKTERKLFENINMTLIMINFQTKINLKSINFLESALVVFVNLNHATGMY